MTKGFTFTFTFTLSTLVIILTKMGNKWDVEDDMQLAPSKTEPVNNKLISELQALINTLIMITLIIDKLKCKIIC